MSVKNTIKLQTYNKNRKETARSVANTLSQLNNLLTKAVLEQAYLRKDPDTLFDIEYIESLSSEFTELKTVFTNISSLVADMESVKNETMTPDELISKYNLDLNTFSASLI